MPRPPLPFQLRPRDRSELEGMLRGGVQQVRVVLRVLSLLQLDRGESAPQVAQAVGLTPPAAPVPLCDPPHGGWGEPHGLGDLRRTLAPIQLQER